MLVIDRCVSEFDKYKDVFYANFDSDNWDYIIIGNDRFSVENLAQKLTVYYYSINKVADEWIAVTYHS